MTLTKEDEEVVKLKNKLSKAEADLNKMRREHDLEQGVLRDAVLSAKTALREYLEA